MTTRLNGVKMTNLLIDVFSSGFLARKNQLSKFNHFFANWFFVNQKGSYALKNRIKLKICNSPKHLVSTIFNVALIQKMELASESSRCPIKKWRFRVVTLQLCSVGRVFASGLHRLVNIKTAFGVYKSGQIGTIYRCNSASISNGFNLCFYRIRYQFAVFFSNFHGLDKRLSAFFEGRFSEIKKNVALISFFNKIWSNSWQEAVSFFGENKMIRWNSILLSRFFNLNCPFKVIFEPFNVIDISGNNRKGVLKKWRSFYFSNVKAPVSIYITSCVS